ncbi:MAG: hypothetical protein K2L63_07075 [Paramuribaculum sp.]|nr:hypothetical protein [Paramuribaculum sp.]
MNVYTTVTERNSTLTATAMTIFTYWLLIIAAVIANLTIGYIINRYALHRHAAATCATHHRSQAKRQVGEA